MKKVFKILVCILIITFTFTLSGCNLDKVKVKMGLKNEDFEYIKQGRVNKIIIQSTRDKGFRFIVTDKYVINDLYYILSSAKCVKQKTNLDPDYVFEIYEGHDKVYKFNYVAGVDSQGGANLYNKDKMYLVSGRLDTDIMKNFWNITMPRDFESVYYNAIFKVLDKYEKGRNKNDSIGIDFKNDVEASKMILSVDMENFRRDLVDKYSNAELVKEDRNKYDVIFDIKTEGYKARLYKMSIKVWNSQEKSEKVYYVWANHENGGWNINIYDDKKPDKF